MNFLKISGQPSLTLLAGSMNYMKLREAMPGEASSL